MEKELKYPQGFWEDMEKAGIHLQGMQLSLADLEYTIRARIESLTLPLVIAMLEEAESNSEKTLLYTKEILRLHRESLQAQEILEKYFDGGSHFSKSDSYAPFAIAV